MIEHRSYADRIGDVVIWLTLGVLSVSCLAPFVHVIAQSLSSALAVDLNRVSLWPIGVNFDNYKYLAKDGLFVGSFFISLARVAVGVTLNLVMAILTAYPLSQDHLNIPGRGVFRVLLLFGMMFGGGLIPTFLAYKSLGLYDSFAVLVVPGAFNMWLTILLTNFFRGLPREIAESALLDGASHFDMLFRIFVPLSKASLATIALFSAVGHWNAWFDGIVYLKMSSQWPLQSYLYSKVTQSTFGQEKYVDVTKLDQITPRALEVAMIAWAAIPIMLVYPLLQRYFVKGLTLGAVKG